MRKVFKSSLFIALAILIVGFCLPEKFSIPVKDIRKSDFNQKSFWAYPWGNSVTHKGVDIFASKGIPVLASIDGLVLRQGISDKGGKYVMLLGPKWRVHYYAHLNEIDVKAGQYLRSGQQIGTVGNTGNAQGKAPHLHYSICSIIPIPWKLDDEIQGWKKMFFINPIPYLNESLSVKNSSALNSE